MLPSDYTFTPGGLVVHKDTLQRLEKLLQQTEDRDPDAHNMYIYNGSCNVLLLCKTDLR